MLLWLAAPGHSAETVGVERFSYDLLKPQPAFPDATDRGPIERFKSLLTYGPLDIRPHFNFTEVYNDNIFVQNQNAQDDFIHTISPGVFLGVWDYQAREGLYLVADYTPSILIFTDHPETDTVDHRVTLTVGRQFAKSAIALNQTFEKTSDPTIEGGGRNTRKIYNTTLSGNYHFSEKTGLEANIYQLINDYENLISSREWANINWLNYRWSPKLNAAAGAGLGYVTADQSPDAVFERLEGRVTYDPSPKMTYILHGGVEFRQFRGHDAGDDLISPIFGLEARYQPYETTMLSLRARREVKPSNLFLNQVNVSTGISLLARQRLFEKFVLGLNTGYDNAKYESTIQGSGNAGQYDYVFVRTDASYEFNAHANVSLYYLYQDNNSDQALNSYQNNQVGVGFTYRF